jgi:NAD dependent epimerase/dehydratase family enzyme
MADAELLSSKRVVPAALQAAGFEFQHPRLEGALRSTIDRPA